MSDSSPLISAHDPIYGSAAMGDLRQDLLDNYGEGIFDDEDPDQEFDEEEEHEDDEDIENIDEDPSQVSRSKLCFHTSKTVDT